MEAMECWGEGQWCVVYIYWGKREREKYAGSVVENVERGFEEREREHFMRGRRRAREKKGEGMMRDDEKGFDDVFSRDPEGFTCGKIMFLGPPGFNRNEVLSCLERIFIRVFDTLKPSGLNKCLASRQGTEEEEERRRKRARGEGESAEERRERKRREIRKNKVFECVHVFRKIWRLWRDGGGGEGMGVGVGGGRNGRGTPLLGYVRDACFFSMTCAYSV